MFSEQVPYRDISSPALLSALASRGIELVVAVTPDIVGDLPNLGRACANAGVGLGLWPMVEEHAGRWANNRNAQHFCAFVRDVLHRIDPPGTASQLTLDFEPHIDAVRGFFRADAESFRWWFSEPDPDADALLGSLILTAHTHGLAVMGTHVPILLADGRSRGWQRLAGVPEVLPDHTQLMLYTSLFETYSGGVLSRSDAQALLRLFCHRARVRFAQHASVALGCVGGGIVGNERGFRSVDELREDVAITRASGVDDIALFDLGGILGRPPIEDWLDALVLTRAAETLPAATLRADLAWVAMRATSTPLAVGLSSVAVARQKVQALTSWSRETYLRLRARKI